MTDQPVETLRQDAASGDAEALTRLGERLLRDGAPETLREAAAALDRAVRAGGVDAPAMLAVMLATGAGGLENITAALDLLQIGAERGCEAAQGQLGVLADRETAATTDGAGRWRALRESIRPESWADAGPRQILSRSPSIYWCGPFLTPEVCRWIIGRAEGRGTLAPLYDPDASGLILNEGARNNSAFAFQLADMDVVMAMLCRRIAVMTGVDPSGLEPPQVLHYRPGQRFEPHYDFLDPDLPGHVSDLALHGQRITTCLVYLNTTFEGGETDFPILGLRHKPPAGAALCFANVQPSGAPDRRTLHAGLAPTSGEKWLLSQWIRDRPAQRPSVR